MTTQNTEVQWDNHNEMVRDLKAIPEEVLLDLTPNKVDLLHMAAGVSGEAGETLDLIKKHVYYNKPLDREALIEEMGDVEFYLEGLRQACGVNRDEVITGNIAKLSKRYSTGSFSQEQAQARADKA